MSNNTASAILEIIASAPKKDLEDPKRLLNELKTAIDERFDLLELEDINEYRKKLVVPLPTLVYIEPNDSKLSELKLSEKHAEDLLRWQINEKVTLALFSADYIREHNITEFWRRQMKHPYTRVEVVFVPWADAAEGHEAAMSTMSLSKAKSATAKQSYNDDDDGINWAGDYLDQRYDMFIISVLIQIEENGRHPATFTLKRPREGGSSVDGAE